MSYLGLNGLETEISVIIKSYRYQKETSSTYGALSLCGPRGVVNDHTGAGHAGCEIGFLRPEAGQHVTAVSDMPAVLEFPRW